MGGSDTVPTEVSHYLTAQADVGVTHLMTLFLCIPFPSCILMAPEWRFSFTDYCLRASAQHLNQGIYSVSVFQFPFPFPFLLRLSQLFPRLLGWKHTTNV